MSDSATELILSLRVVPNASRSEVVGWHGDALKVKVQAPPEGGRANDEVIATLAKALEVHKRSITIEQGATSRSKRLRIAGVTSEQLSKAFPK